MSEQPEQPVGDLGIGRGGAARPPRLEPPSMSSLIRAARRAKRQHIYDEARALDQQRSTRR
jgi:hypothetical protein